MASSNTHGFSTPNAQDHRPWLWIASLLSAIYSLLTAGARITSKWGLLGLDDAILGVGYLFALAHYGLTFASLNAGLGASLDIVSPSDTLSAARTFFFSRIFAIVGMCLCKLSMMAFIRRIFSGNVYYETAIFGASFVLIAIWGIVSVVLLTVSCHPSRSLIAEANAVCPANKSRWIAITTIDVVTELLLVIVPCIYVSKNQIKASKKRVVAFVFSFRLLVVGFSIASLVTYFNFLDNGGDSIGLASYVVWQQVLVGTAFISASIPSLRTFLWAFMSRGFFTMYGVRSTSDSMGGSYVMNSMRRSQAAQGGSVNGTATDPKQSRGRYEGGRLRPDWIDYAVDVHARGAPKANGSRQNTSTGSDRSDQMIIHRDVEIEIHND